MFTTSSQRLLQGLASLPPRDAVLQVEMLRFLRLTAAGVALAALPIAVIVLREPPTALAAVLLALLLPAVIALDTNRPVWLDRALVMNIVVATIVLVGGVLRGLEPVPAMAFLACLWIELTLLGSRRLRHRRGLWLAAFCAAGMGAVWIAHMQAGPFRDAAPLLSNAVMALAFGQLALLALMMRMQGRKEKPAHTPQASPADEPDLFVDRHGRVLGWREGAARVLGFPASTLARRGLMDLVLVADRPLFMMEVSEALQNDASRRVRLRLRVAPDTVEQGYRWIGLTLDRQGQPDGQLRLRLWPVENDVARETHLADAPITDLAATALRASFISRMNHELRTPLNAVIGFSDIMMRGGFEADQMRDFAREINEAGQDLLRSASLMIDLTRMEKGIFQLDVAENDAARLVETVVRAESDAASYDLDLPETNAPIWVDGRIVRTALQQVLALTRFDASDTRKRRICLRVSADHVELALGRAGDPDPLNLSATDARTLLTEAPSACRLGLAMAQGVAALHQSVLILSTSQAGNLQMRWRFNRAIPASEPGTTLKAA